MPYSENGSTAPIGAVDLSPRREPWVGDPSLTPTPLPTSRERGADGGEWVVFPRACALGYNLPPLTGLRKGHPHVEDFNCELLTQDT
ncbi:MAG: hypothetical protein ACLQVM_21535, partial [Terriglobia bacterium]